MDKKGFTLVELVATIAIMLLVTTIAVPSIISIVNKSEDKLDSATKKQLIAYAKSYVKENNFTIEKNKTYCVLVSNLTDTEIKDSENNAVTGRIEIKNQNDKINYTYNTINDMNGCSEFSSGKIELKNDQISLKSNDNPTIDHDSMLGKLVEKYEVNPTVPDFRYKSPIDLNGGNGARRKLIRDLTAEEKTYKGMATFYPCIEGMDEPGCTFHSTRKEVSYTESSTDYLYYAYTRAYFGDGYTFNEATGEYTLTNPEKNFMKEAVNNGKKFACRSSDSYTCDKMYEIETYSSGNVGNVNSNPNIIGSNFKSRMDSIKTGKVYTSIPDIDKSDSGLYRTLDADGITYYFRGAITNNYVKLGGTLFQILRFNGDGSIRLVGTDSIGEKINADEYSGLYTLPTYKIYEGIIGSTISYNYYVTGTYASSSKLTGYFTFTLYNSVELSDNKSSSSEILTKDGTERTIEWCYNNQSSCVGKYILTSKSAFFDSYSSNTKKYFLANKNVSKIKSITKNGNLYTLDVKFMSITPNSDEQYDSSLKSKLESWYKNKMSDYDMLVVPGRFCNDVTPSSLLDTNDCYYGSDGYECSDNTPYSPYIRLRNYKNVTPTYICSLYKHIGTGSEYIEKVGTLTADDVAFAGAISLYENNDHFKANSNNPDFFLYRQGGYITLSLQKSNQIYSLSTSSYDGISPDTTPAYLSGNSTSEDVYPVINIRGDVKFTGNGTKNDPYVIDTD